METLEQMVVDLLEPVDSPLLGLLPKRGDPPASWLTRRPGDAAAYFGPGANPGSTARRPSRELVFPIRPDRRSVWVTFADDRGHRVSGTYPTAVVSELGLLYPEGTFVYRIDLPVRAAPACVPTALDAKLHEAWAPPPDPNADHGMTRDLVDGAPRWPELVVNASDHEGRWIGQLVSPPGSPQAVGALSPDFMAGRRGRGGPRGSDPDDRRGRPLAHV